MSILVIYTGGTIGMLKNEKGVLVPGNGDNIKEVINTENSSTEFYAIPTPIDSSDISVNTLNYLISLVHENYKKYTGFLLLMGTDTMAYVSSVLHYCLQNLDKALLITGGQIPIAEKENDSYANLIGGIQTLKGTPSLSGVHVYFGGNLLKGNKVTKYSSYAFDGFKAPNSTSQLSTVSNNKFLHILLKEKNIQTYTVHPFIKLNSFIKILEDTTYDALILLVYGAGNLKKEFVNAIISRKNTKTKVIVKSQCLEGGTELGKYSSSISVQSNLILDAQDMTLEATLAKLMFLFTQNVDDERFKDGFLLD